MKEICISSILAILLAIPAFLSATVVRLVEWKRPNGTRIVVMYDIHMQSQKEKLQKSDLISHLQSQKNACLSVEDPREIGACCPDGLISGLVSFAREKNIQASSLEFRNFDFDKKNNHMTKYYSSLKDSDIPFKKEFKALGEKLKTIKVHEDFSESIIKLADFVFLSRIMQDKFKDKNMYVVVGADHANFLARAFTQYNYTKTLECGIEPDVDDLFDEKWNSLIDKYALGLEATLKQCGKQ